MPSAKVAPAHEVAVLCAAQPPSALYIAGSTTALGYAWLAIFPMAWKTLGMLL